MIHILNCEYSYHLSMILKALTDYLGGEGAILNAINGVPIQGSWWSCTCCLSGTPFTIATLRFCKKATLQVSYYFQR